MTFRNTIALTFVVFGAAAAPALAQSSTPDPLAPASDAIVCPDPATIDANTIVPPECKDLQVLGAQIDGVDAKFTSTSWSGGDDEDSNESGGERGESDDD